VDSYTQNRMGTESVMYLIKTILFPPQTLISPATNRVSTDCNESSVLFLVIYHRGVDGCNNVS
jgi:hypothetical protein